MMRGVDLFLHMNAQTVQHVNHLKLKALNLDSVIAGHQR